MIIKVNTSGNKAPFIYYVGVGKKKVAFAPNSSITFTDNETKDESNVKATELFKDTGCLEAMKKNHVVVVSDGFVAVEKTETKVEAPAPQKSSAKEQCGWVKDCETVEALEALELTNSSAKAMRTTKIKKLNK